MTATPSDSFVIAGTPYRSRLLTGTGKFKDLEETRLATEAAAAIAHHAHERLGLPRLVCLILPGNAASRRVAEKIGMRRERELGPEYGGASLYARSASMAYDAEPS